MSTNTGISRRGILKGIVSGALVLGFDPIGRSWVTEAEAAGPFAGLPQLDGTVRTDPAALAEAADDWGHIVHRTPLAVLYAESISDVQKMVKYAKSQGLRVVGRGKGHTAFGQSQANAGIVIDTRYLNEIHSISKSSKRAVVGPGVVWRDLLEETLDEGLAPPVLTDYISLTVAGTLSVGGVGGASFRYGAQVDNVEELKVVTGTGELLTCSDNQNKKLFQAALAGLGLCGIIVRVTLRLIKAKQRAETYKLYYANVTKMLQDIRTLVEEDRFDYVRGNGMPGPTGWTWFIEATRFYDPCSHSFHHHHHHCHDCDEDDDELLECLSFNPALTEVSDATYFDYADTTNQLFGLLGSLGLTALPHPWLDVFVPGSAQKTFIPQTIAGLDPTPYLPGSIILIFPFLRCAVDQPLFRVPDDDYFVLFDILPTIPPDPNLVNATLQKNRAIYDGARARGGTLYTISAVNMSKQDWKAHFGDAYQKLKQAKDQYDPQNVLGAGPNVF